MRARIAVAVTTLNRRQIFNDTMAAIRRWTPRSAPVFVVDDGSDDPVPGADHRNATPQGVAAAKNKCFELLMQTDADHFFLFDDDTHPTKPRWWEPYVTSGQLHLMYLHANQDPDRKVVFDDGYLWAMDSGTGCMLYFTRRCIALAGGMRTEFGRWSFEHLEHSQRIHNMGLTDYPYMDVHQDGIFSLDEHQHGSSAVDICTRQEHYRRNQRLWEKYRHSTGFVPYAATAS